MSSLTMNFNFYLPAEGDGQDDGQIWTSGVNGNFTTLDTLLKSHADSLLALEAHAAAHAPGGADALPWTTINGRGTTAAKPAPSAANAGYTYFDTTLQKLQRSSGTAWEDTEGASGGGASLSPNALINGATVSPTATGVLAIPTGVPPSGSVAGVAQVYFVDTGLVNQVPAMTSDTTPSGVSSAASIWGAGREAWRAFDGITSSCWMHYTGNLPTWLQYQFPTAKVITAYSILLNTALTFAPKDWTLQGSNNGSTWTVLDTKSGITSGWVSGVPRLILIPNTTAYTYYRLSVTALNGYTDMQIMELALLSGMSGLFVRLPDGTQKQLAYL